MSAARPDRSRRVTPELMDYHKAHAHRLRAEARRKLGGFLKRLWRRH